ncbi:MAG: hypothetical protein IJ802_06315, partial [Kiritimatiellae bacterium]|nr:hypothetical protein [Kiritimatiellia bacterium]
MTGRLAILAGAGAICFAQCNATILFYDGCPIDSSKGYKVDTALNASPNTTPSNDKIKGFSENWNGGTGVLKAYNTSLAFPNSFSATQTANRGDGKFGLVNAGTDKNRPRVQVRKLQNALTAANLSGESAFYFRAMLATSQAALGTLTPEEGLTEKNSRGVGVLHYDKPTYAGHHSSDSSSAYYLLMPTLSKRFVWLGINCHEEGKGALECSIKGSDGEVKTATLIDAVEADATYIACAKLEISADGKEIVTAFAQPVAGYNRSADWVQVGEADLIDYSENSLNCVVFGGNYQTQNGAVYFDEFCGATTLEEAVDWSAGAEPYVSMATFEGNPAEGLAVSVTLANAPESATVRCYAGDTAASVADSAEAVVTWTDESGPTWRYEFPAATWGLTYYARFTIEYGGGGGDNP